MGSKMSNVGRSDKAILDVRQKSEFCTFLGNVKKNWHSRGFLKIMFVRRFEKILKN